MTYSLKQLSITCLTTISLFNTSFGQQLQLRLELEKDGFLEAEPTFAFVYLINRGTTNVNVYLFYDWELRFFLYDESGKAVTQVLSSITDAYFVQPDVLSAGEKFTEMENLQSIFANSRKGFYERHLVAGQYTVSVRYLHFNEHTRQSDTLISNTVSFQVVRPQGEEETAFQLLMEAMNLLEERNYDEHIQKLHRLIQQYPASFYVPAAYQKLRSGYHLWKHDYSKADETILQLVDRYPDRGAGVYALLTIMKINDKYFAREKKEELLKTYSRKYPYTRVGRFSEGQLKMSKHIVR